MSFHQAVYPTIPEEESSESGHVPSTNRRVIIGAAAVLVSLGAITTISVCAAGKCRARRDIPTNVVQIPTDIPTLSPSTLRPTTLATQLPSDLPSDVPSLQPSLAPTGVPTAKPSLRPSSSTNTALAGAEDGECNLIGCFLRNLDSNTETKLSGVDTYSIDDVGGSEASYSIRCETNAGLAYLEFITAENTVREWNAPYWMAANDAESAFVNPVAALSTCGDKSFRVATSVSDGGGNCIDQAFQLTALCEPVVAETKVSAAQVAALELNPVELMVVAPIASGEECSVVDCYLLNIDTSEELFLSGNDTYSIDASAADAYSVGCSALEDVDYIDFSYSDHQHREWNAPFWMNGNSGDSWVEPSRHLSSCGDNSFGIEVSSDGTLCTQSFTLTALC